MRKEGREILQSIPAGVAEITSKMAAPSSSLKALGHKRLLQVNKRHRNTSNAHLNLEEDFAKMVWLRVFLKLRSDQRCGLQHLSLCKFYTNGFTNAVPKIEQAIFFF